MNMDKINTRRSLASAEKRCAVSYPGTFLAIRVCSAGVGRWYGAAVNVPGLCGRNSRYALQFPVGLAAGAKSGNSGSQGNRQRTVATAEKSSCWLGFILNFFTLTFRELSRIHNRL
jgi:hypothetical protein